MTEDVQKLIINIIIKTSFYQFGLYTLLEKSHINKNNLKRLYRMVVLVQTNLFFGFINIVHLKTKFDKNKQQLYIDCRKPTT